MFRFTKKLSSRSHSQYLAKITRLVQCRYIRRTDVVAVAAEYDLCGLRVVHSANLYACTVHNTHNVCTTSVSTLNEACNFS
jgi:hypothetical protein